MCFILSSRLRPRPGPRTIITNGLEVGLNFRFTNTRVGNMPTTLVRYLVTSTHHCTVIQSPVLTTVQ